MTTNALSELDVNAPTVKRAQYEALKFDLEAPDLLQVTNGSYGDDEKTAHSYRVNIANGVLVACECPSDTYHDGACKHRVAVAISEPVLEAATADDSRDRVATDGGDLVVAGDEGAVLETDDVSASPVSGDRRELRLSLGKHRNGVRSAASRGMPSGRGLSAVVSLIGNWDQLLVRGGPHPQDITCSP